MYAMVFYNFQETNHPYPVLKINGGEHILKANKTIVSTDDNGTTDITLGVALLMAVYWVYGFEYPKKLRKTFQFLESFVFELSTAKTAPVPVVRLHADLTRALWRFLNVILYILLYKVLVDNSTFACFMVYFVFIASACMNTWMLRSMGGYSDAQQRKGESVRRPDGIEATSPSSPTPIIGVERTNGSTFFHGKST